MTVTSDMPLLEESTISVNRLSRSPKELNPRNLKFERADWTLFRSISTLPQKAGVPAKFLRRLVLKELTDNSLDAGGEVEVGGLDDGGYYVQDDGPGIDPDEIATLFARWSRRNSCGSRPGVRSATTGGKAAMERKLSLFDDRLISLALHQLAAANSESN